MKMRTILLFFSCFSISGMELEPLNQFMDKYFDTEIDPENPEFDQNYLLGLIGERLDKETLQRKTQIAYELCDIDYVLAGNNLKQELLKLCLAVSNADKEWLTFQEDLEVLSNLQNQREEVYVFLRTLHNDSTIKDPAAFHIGKKLLDVKVVFRSINEPKPPPLPPRDRVPQIRTIDDWLKFLEEEDADSESDDDIDELEGTVLIAEEAVEKDALKRKNKQRYRDLQEEIKVLKEQLEGFEGREKELGGIIRQSNIEAIKHKIGFVLLEVQEEKESLEGLIIEKNTQLKLLEEDNEKLEHGIVRRRKKINKKREERILRTRLLLAKGRRLDKRESMLQTRRDQIQEELERIQKDLERTHRAKVNAENEFNELKRPLERAVTAHRQIVGLNFQTLLQDGVLARQHGTQHGGNES